MESCVVIKSNQISYMTLLTLKIIINQREQKRREEKRKKWEVNQFM